MEYNKLIEKTNNIITWLDVNDVGSMDTVLRGLITSEHSQTPQSAKALNQPYQQKYWPLWILL